MDIQYLLWIQTIRESLPEAVTKLFLIISDAGAGTLALLILAGIFWCTEKKNGRIIVLSYGTGFVVNQLAKHIFCTYRPWIRSSQIHPVQSALPSGYSFPSGHSQFAASEFGSLAWLYRKKRILAACSLILMLLVGFSRNFLGYHTPQDVLFGFAFGLGATAFIIWITKWIDQKEGRDLTFIIIGILAVIALLILEELRPYPMDYVNGVLLVDPEEMLLGCYGATGCQIALLLGWFIEKRYIQFDSEGKVLHRIIRYVIGVVLFIVYAKFLLPLVIHPFPQKIQSFLQLFLIVTFIILLYPWMIHAWQKRSRKKTSSDAN